MSSSSLKAIFPSDPLSYPIHQYPFAFLDYIWVISVYVSLSFSLAVIIDGYILPPFDMKTESTESSLFLGGKVLLQFGVQGFIALLLCSILQKVPSPFNGFFGYDPHSPLGVLIRNPSIIYIILLTLSASLRARLLYLFSRFNKNASPTTTSVPVVNR